ncbi:MAG: VCBS repeat-containing protein [Candidatus Midichloria sp.]|nr:VCBS repeat-containing protein [Candidatus Midichloria sp.]
MNNIFSLAINYNVGSMPTEIGASDLNNDGKQDIIVSNAGSNTISVLLGSGNGRGFHLSPLIV